MKDCTFTQKVETSLDLAQLPVTAARACYDEGEISRNWGPPLASPDPLLEKETAGIAFPRPLGVSLEQGFGRARSGEEGK